MALETLRGVPGDKAWAHACGGVGEVVLPLSSGTQSSALTFLSGLVLDQSEGERADGCHQSGFTDQHPVDTLLACLQISGTQDSSVRSLKTQQWRADWSPSNGAVGKSLRIGPQSSYTSSLGRGRKN